MKVLLSMIEIVDHVANFEVLFRTLAEFFR